MTTLNIFARLSLLLALLLLVGCTSTPPKIAVFHPHHAHPVQAKQYKSHRACNRPYRVKGKMYYPMTSPEGYSEVGMASWYGWESGSKTALGTAFRPDGVSAAHKTLPLPSKVRVTNLRNGRSIVLVVNDRGPYKHNRIIDLSHGAAKKIGLTGLAKVRVDYVGRAE